MQHAGHKRTASEREVADEDFIIHSSQSYNRTASQSIPDLACSEVLHHHTALLPSTSFLHGSQMVKFNNGLSAEHHVFLPAFDFR